MDMYSLHAGRCSLTFPSELGECVCMKFSGTADFDAKVSGKGTNRKIRLKSSGEHFRVIKYKKRGALTYGGCWSSLRIQLVPFLRVQKGFFDRSFR